MQPAIEIRNLHKTYDTGLKALQSINLTISKGDFYALLGPNGAGKSTTIGILTSLVTKTSGSVRVMGHCIDDNQEMVKRSIGLVPQEFNFNMFEKVWDILTQQAGYYGIPYHQAKINAEKYLKLTELWDKRFAISRTLSGGMKRRLMIARAMIHEPQVLVLDEPTAGVDIEIRRGMWEFLRELNRSGTTIILTTHYLEEVEQLCKNVAIINKGDIILDTSIRNLLSQLNTQTFILDLKEQIQEAPQHPKFVFRKTDTQTLEVDLAKEDNLNEIFTFLSSQSILAQSLRTKSNRIEELFLHLIRTKGA